MGRLIDAEALKKYLRDYKWEFAMGSDFSKAMEMIDAQPTAYDVEKVVEQLRCDTNCPNCSERCADAFVCGAEEVIKQAIEIVRKGGVE